jgi:hypothetical protein
MTMDVIRTRGNHYEIGIQHARIYRSLVGQVNMIKILRGMGLIQAAKPIGGPPFNIVFGQIISRGAKKIIASINENLPNQFEKIEGMAEGFGVTVESLAQILYFENFSGDMRFDTGLPKGCSGGIITNRDQGFLIKNYDFPNELGEWQITRYCHLTKDGYSHVGLGEGPLPGLISGQNNKGLAVSFNAAYTGDLNMRAPPTSLVMNECLETCQTTEEAIELFKSVPIAYGQIILILDKDNHGAVVERTANSFGVREMTPTEDGKGSYLGASNTFQHPDVRKMQLPEDTIWVVKGIYGNEIVRGSDIRSNRITELSKQLAEKKQPISLKELNGAISDHNDGEPGENTVCRHGVFWKTLSTVYMEPKLNHLYVNDDNPCKIKDVKELKEHKLKFDYEMPNIRWMRKYNPDFNFYDPLSG